MINAIKGKQTTQKVSIKGYKRLKLIRTSIKYAHFVNRMIIYYHIIRLSIKQNVLSFST